MPFKGPVKVKVPSGEVVNCYYLYELAERLGRQSQTVRKWEIAGTIPQSGFCDKFNCRLYSEEQMQIIIEEAERAHLRPGRHPAHTTFAMHVSRRMKELSDRYMTPKKNSVEV